MDEQAPLLDSSDISVEIPVRFRDCDPLGHVNNAVYLTYFEVARTEYWRRVVGATTTFDWPFVLAEATVTYRSPARFGEVLRVTVGVESVGNRSWVFRYRITEAGSGREVATGRTVQVAYDHVGGRSQPIPEPLRAVLVGRRPPTG